MPQFVLIDVCLAIVVFDKNVQLGIVKCVIKVIKCVLMLIGVVNLEQIKATRVRSTISDNTLFHYIAFSVSPHCALREKSHLNSRFPHCYVYFS